MKHCLFDNPTLGKIAAAHNASVAQVCLRWVLDRGCTIAVGTGAHALPPLPPPPPWHHQRCRCCRRRRRRCHAGTHTETHFEDSHLRELPEPAGKLTLGKCMGDGAYGKVYVAYGNFDVVLF